MKLHNHQIPANCATLAALRYAPDNGRQSTAILYAHGFTAGKYTFDGLAGYLANKGYEGLTFDFVGHKLGGTGGELHNMTQTVENLQAALAWYRNTVPAERIVLVGHSMGAVAVLRTAIQEVASPVSPPIAGVACLCMGVEPHIGFQSVVGRTMQSQRAAYVQGAPVAELSAQLGSLLPTAQEIGGLPALFVAAQQDVLFSVERVERLASLAGRNTQVMQIEASHQDAPDKSKSVLLKWLSELS